MPPLFSSTSLTTLVRRVVNAARYVQPAAMSVPSAARSTAPRRTINTLHRTRNAVQQLVHQSFPSLTTPSHQLHHVGQTARTAARGFASASPTRKAATRRSLGPVAQAVQSSTKRPRFITGPSVPANVGLGSARTFASGPAASAHAKVPMGLRALASLLDDEKTDKALPRATRYAPYSRGPRQRRMRQGRCPSIDSSLIREIQHYFPLPSTLRQSPAEVTLPILPEDLVTPGTTAVLALPLSPSLDALLSPTASITYVDTEIGIHIFARLTRGLLPIHEAFSLHASTRINPLLHKLDGLGVLDFNPSSPRTEAAVVRDSQGRPDILRLVFRDRSVADVKQLLGESLRTGEEGEWWALYEEKTGLELSVVESREMMEDWGVRADSHERPSTPSSDTSEELIFPTLDMSSHTAETIFDVEDDMSFTSSPQSWPSSGSVTPFSPGFVTPQRVSITSTLDHSLTASLLSELASQTSDDGAWEVSPSEADSDVESAYSGGESWGDISTHSVMDDDEAAGQSVRGRWTGSGEGFGLLQPW